MRLVICLALALQAFAQLPSVPSTPVLIIHDTDIGEDIDDGDETYMLSYLEQLGYCRVIANISTTNVAYSASVLESYMNYAGQPGRLIGSWQGSSQSATDHYAQTTQQHFQFTTRTTQGTYPVAVDVYRQALASAANGSVVILATGYGSNLAALLQSSADGYSALTGVQLVAAKVSKLVWVAGSFPSGHEYNIYREPISAAYVFANWPTALYSPGIEIGDNIVVGSGLYGLANSNINKYAHQQYGSETRQGWGEVGVLYAVLGLNGYFTLSAIGTTTVNTGTGNNSWASSPQSNQFYLITARPNADFVTLINSMLTTEIAVKGASMSGNATLSGSAAIQ